MRNRLLLSGGQVLTPAGWSDSDVVISDRHVSAIGRRKEASQSDSSGVTVEDVLDVSGLYVLPGFVDLQVNGGWGVDFASNPEGIWEVGQRLAASGVTAWLPTLITSLEGQWQRAIDALADRPDGWVGAEPLGWHFEGPWLNPTRKGAHRRELLRIPKQPLAACLDSSEGLAMMTLAPEVEGCFEAIEALRDRGVVVSLGHSDCDIAMAANALAAGATMGTHLFNAMSGADHRTPGLVAALLTADGLTSDGLTTGVYFGIIADGIHSAPEMVKLAWMTGGQRLVLVSDMMAGLGLAPGVVSLGAKEVHLDGTSARLADGTLAGSVLDMPSAIRNLREFSGCSLAEAVNAASAVPSRVLANSALADFGRGELAPGSVADLVVVDDQINVVATVIGGRLIYEAVNADKLIKYP